MRPVQFTGITVADNVENNAVYLPVTNEIPDVTVAVFQILLAAPRLRNVAARTMDVDVTGGNAVQRIGCFGHFIPEKAAAGAKGVHHHMGSGLFDPPYKGDSLYFVAPDENTRQSIRFGRRTFFDFGNKRLHQINMLRGWNAHTGHQNLGDLCP